MQQADLLDIVTTAVDRLRERGLFNNGFTFRRTQHQALDAFSAFLKDENRSVADRLTGYFKLPTGVGKTALFSALLDTISDVAQERGIDLRSTTVVPTTNLVNQTKAEIGKYTNIAANDLGIYDGRSKQDRAHTVTTYPSWSKRVEKGTLHAQNTDLLIFDEGHRGKSEARLAYLTQHFNTQAGHPVLNYGFSATPQGMERSHKNLIFAKELHEVVRDGGELSSYIQTQFFEIRIDPSELDKLPEDFEKASEYDIGAYRKAIKEQAWNNRVTAIFRNGVDDRTGDLLTDNQAGFFTNGIKQAAQLEEQLNADPELQRRALEQGYEQVAVAVHSKLPRKEVEQKIADYKAGKILAIIADEQIKEGFDHAPMKTVFDCAHGSHSDKEQIIGRGARRWLNPNKDNRSEGLTFIDTILYIGDNDPTQDARNRRDALKAAVLAIPILRGVSINEDNYENIGVKLTLDMLNQTIDAHTKAFEEAPHGRSGVIQVGPLAGATTWDMLNRAIRIGTNHLMEDDAYKKWRKEVKDRNHYPSLTTLVASRSGMDWTMIGDMPITNKIFEGEINVKEYTSLEDVFLLDEEVKDINKADEKIALKMDMIHDAIKHYMAENNGETPSYNSGIITCPGWQDNISWASVNGYIHYKGGGLSNDPEFNAWADQIEKDGKTLGLAAFKTAFGYEKEIKITMDMIHDAVKQYMAENNGKTPSLGLGTIICPGWPANVTWSSVHGFVRNRGGGLSNDPEFNAWADQIEKDGKTLGLAAFKTAFGYETRLTMAMIHDAVKHHMAENNGKTPSQESGTITCPSWPENITWLNVNSAIRKQGNGLGDDPAFTSWVNKKEMGGKPLGLSLFKATFDYELPMSITMDMLHEAIKYYMKENNGKTPSPISGTITCPGWPENITWQNVDNYLKNKNSCFSEDRDFKLWADEMEEKGLSHSLSNFKNTFGYARKRQKFSLTVDMLHEAIQHYMKENNGKAPAITSETVTCPNWPENITWTSVNGYIRLKGANLPDDPEFTLWADQLEMDGAKIGLIAFKTTFGYEKKDLSLSLTMIYEAIEHYKKNNENSLPSENGELITCPGWPDNITWKSLSGFIQRKSRGLSNDTAFTAWANQVEQSGERLTLATLKNTFLDDDGLQKPNNELAKDHPRFDI